MKFIPSIIFLIVFSSCAFQPIQRSKTSRTSRLIPSKNFQELESFPQKKNKISSDDFYPWRKVGIKGKRKFSNFLGSRMARRDVVTVIIDYPFGPQITQLPR